MKSDQLPQVMSLSQRLKTTSVRCGVGKRSSSQTSVAHSSARLEALAVSNLLVGELNCG